MGRGRGGGQRSLSRASVKWGLGVVSASAEGKEKTIQNDITLSANNIISSIYLRNRFDHTEENFMNYLNWTNLSPHKIIFAAYLQH